MRRVGTIAVAVFVVCAMPLSAHDPRTTAKTLSHGLDIEGAGKLSVSYKGLHFNDATYQRMKSNDQFRERMNAGLWSNIGKIDAGFELVVGGQAVAKGVYTLGLNIGADDTFSLVFVPAAGGTKQTIALKATADNPDHPYLTFTLYPTDKADMFVFEGRCGKFLGTTDVKVPYLAEHAHPPEKK